MESSFDWDQTNLVNELSQGKELARQLHIHLNAPSSPHEARELLVHKILNSYDRALTMLKWSGPLARVEPQPNTEGAIIGPSNSPRSFSLSPNSDDSGPEFKDPEVRKEPKKGKSMPRWTKQVKVCPGKGVEGTLEDGYSWRKYGQKDILGAKYPRGYYRCTHRLVQGCLATKQVQRSDEDATTFEITYRGRHTCINGSRPTTPPSTSPEKMEPTAAFQYQQQMTQQQQNQNQAQDALLGFKTGLRVVTEDLQPQNHNFYANSDFHFASSSHVNAENNFISPPSAENKFPGNYFSPSLTYPSMSGSNYYSVSPTGMAGFGEARDIAGLNSELMDIISGPVSADNSPTVGLDFPFRPMDQFEPNFNFDSPNFFSDF